MEPTSQYVAPLEEESSYGVSNGFYSLVIQRVAGANYRMFAATMGHAGNYHD